MSEYCPGLTFASSDLDGIAHQYQKRVPLTTHHPANEHSYAIRRAKRNPEIRRFRVPTIAIRIMVNNSSLSIMSLVDFLPKDLEENLCQFEHRYVWDNVFFFHTQYLVYSSVRIRICIGFGNVKNNPYYVCMSDFKKS
jgi:hypothetical protein